jgi:hypothetical protein
MKGMAQKAQRWSHPSEILTYALGPLTRRPAAISRSSSPGSASSTSFSESPGARASSSLLTTPGSADQLRAPTKASMSGSSWTSSSA